MPGIAPARPLDADGQIAARLKFLEDQLEQLERAHPMARIMVTLTPVDPAPEGTIRLGEDVPSGKRAASFRINGTWRYVLLT